MAQRINPRGTVAGSADPTERPAYLVTDAAHHLRLPARTVRDWVLGRSYPTGSGSVRVPPLIRLADPARGVLSFLNLVELHVIASVRRVHRVELRTLRRAIAYLGKSLGSAHPLLDRAMLTDGTSLFIERYGSLVNISEHGQTHIKAMLEAHLKRIEWDASHVPIRLFPFSRELTEGGPQAVEGGPQAVAIDPRVRSGRPCIVGTGVPTEVVAGRYRAGDSIAQLAADYERPTADIEEAVRYESRAAS